MADSEALFKALICSSDLRPNQPKIASVFSCHEVQFPLAPESALKRVSGHDDGANYQYFTPPSAYKVGADPDQLTLVEEYREKLKEQKKKEEKKKESQKLMHNLKTPRPESPTVDSRNQPQSQKPFQTPNQSRLPVSPSSPDDVSMASPPAVSRTPYGQFPEGAPTLPLENNQTFAERAQAAGHSYAGLNQQVSFTAQSKQFGTTVSDYEALYAVEAETQHFPRFPPTGQTNSQTQTPGGAGVGLTTPYTHTHHPSSSSVPPAYPYTPSVPASDYYYSSGASGDHMAHHHVPTTPSYPADPRDNRMSYAPQTTMMMTSSGTPSYGPQRMNGNMNMNMGEFSTPRTRTRAPPTRSGLY